MGTSFRGFVVCRARARRGDRDTSPTSSLRARHAQTQHADKFLPRVIHSGRHGNWPDNHGEWLTRGRGRTLLSTGMGAPVPTPRRVCPPTVHWPSTPQRLSTAPALPRVACQHGVGDSRYESAGPGNTAVSYTHLRAHE